MLELEVLVFELVAVDALSSGSVMVGEVTTCRKLVTKENKTCERIFSHAIAAPFSFFVLTYPDT